MTTEVKLIERGWVGHFICGHRCRFRRNTLIEYGERRIVVSTVGLMPKQEYAGNGFHKDATGFDEIGLNRHYETMAFRATFKDGYWEADIGEQISFESPWALNETEQMSDGKANVMHDEVVRELAATIMEAS